MSRDTKRALLILAVIGTLGLIYALFWPWSQGIYHATHFFFYGDLESSRILCFFIVAVLITVEIGFFGWLFSR